MSVAYTSQAKAARRLSWFILFVIGVALTVTLYYVKTRAQSARADVQRLTQQIEAETATIRVLRAELAVLENPQRLAVLAQQELGLSPIAPAQTFTADDIPALFEMRAEESPAP